MSISNPIYKGVLRFGDELSPPIERLRIVSDDEFDCCEALVKGRAPERPEKPVEPIQQGSRNLLTGLIFCGYCRNRLCYSLAHDRRAVPWKEERRKCLIAGVCPQSLSNLALRAFFVFGGMVL